MNLFLFELKKNRFSFILWSISLLTLQFLLMAFFPTVSKDAELMDTILAYYPEALLKAMGMGGAHSMSSILGYLTFILVFIQLCLAIQSAYIGFSFLSVEERELTADFLLTKPISRLKIFMAKYIAHLIVIMGIALVTCISIWLSILAFANGKPYEEKTLFLIFISIPLFQVTFFHIGMVVTVLTSKIKSPLTYTMGFAFSMYMLNAMQAILGGSWLGILSPFYHYEISSIVEMGSLNFSRSWISFAFLALSIGLSLPLYIKRDIQAR